MAAEVKLTIDLNKKEKVFSAGEEIWGKAVLLVQSDIKFNALLLRINGRGIVINPRSDDQKNGKCKIANEEVYCSLNICLWGEDKINYVETLQMGRHTFPFVYKLPQSVPCSFVGKFGSVEYSADAIFIDDKNRQLKKASICFTVIRELELQCLQNEEHEFQREQRFHRLGCLSSGEVNCNLKLQGGRYAPGERVVFDLEIENQSTIKGKEVCVLLRQNIEYYGHCAKVACESCAVHVEKLGLLQSHSRSVWNKHTIVLPVLPPTGMDGCAIIDIQYQLEVTLDGFNGKPMVTTPIIVGTTPSSSGNYRKLEWRYSEMNCNPPYVLQRTNSMVPMFKEYKNIGIPQTVSLPLFSAQ